MYLPPSSDGKTGQKKIRIDIVREILAAVSGIALVGPKDGVAWRGHASNSWRLESKLGRHEVSVEKDEKEWRDYEHDLIGTAREQGIDGSQRSSDFEILARLRHHGAATRLIDFSRDPMVALWFACNDPTEKDSDGILLALDRGSVTRIKDPGSEKFVPKGPPRQVNLFSVPSIDPRISAQRGLFVYADDHTAWAKCSVSEIGNDVPTSWKAGRLTTMCSSTGKAGTRGRLLGNFPDIVGVAIPRVVKSLILDTLKSHFGHTRSTMFPDYSALGEYYSTPRM